MFFFQEITLKNNTIILLNLFMLMKFKSRLLKKHLVRATEFRLKLLSLFKANNESLSIKEIENKLGNFDRVTLYRTLKLFNEKGVIHEVFHGGGGKRYALCKEGCSENKHSHSHLHFHCSKCDKSFCIDDNMPKLHLPGYLVKNCDLNVYGLCQKCNI